MVKIWLGKNFFLMKGWIKQIIIVNFWLFNSTNGTPYKLHFLNESLPFIRLFKHCYCTLGINGKWKLFYWHILTIILYFSATHLWNKLAVFSSKVTSGAFLTIHVGALIRLNRGPDLEINSTIMYRGWGWQELSQHCLIYYKPLWAQIVRRPDW